MQRRDPFASLIVALGAIQLAAGATMALAPGFFFDEIATYGARNDHYVRDLATFYLAAGAIALVAAARASWRTPVLALIALQYALHAVNHVVDVGDARPERLGAINLALVGGGALASIALLAAWRRRR